MSSTDLQTKYEEWAAQFLKAPTVRMDEPLTEMFLGLALRSRTGLPVPGEVISHPLYRITELRAKAIGLTIDSVATALIAVLSKGRPGTAVMYVSALATLGVPVTLDVLVNQFPMGFIPEEELECLWDAQKGDYPLGNLLDAIAVEKEDRAPAQSV